MRHGRMVHHVALVGLKASCGARLQVGKDVKVGRQVLATRLNNFEVVGEGRDGNTRGARHFYLIGMNLLFV